jgi:hypothetical protein
VRLPQKSRENESRGPALSIQNLRIQGAQVVFIDYTRDPDYEVTFSSFDLSAGPVPLWIAIRRNAVQTGRILAAAQLALVLLGWFGLQFPLIINSSSDPLTIYTAAAPEPALRYLLYALIAGSAIVLPALTCLRFSN